MNLRRSTVAQGGYTIMEVLIVMAVLAIISQAFAVFMRTSSRINTASRLKSEAFEHALQMLEELRDIAADGSVAIEELDKFDDGRNTSTQEPLYKFTLTAKREVTHPGGNTLPDCYTGAHALSANPQGTSGYNYVRHIEVKVPANDAKLRTLRVRVWAAQNNAGNSGALACTATAFPDFPCPTCKQVPPLAEIVGTVRSLATGNRPSQVMDIYLIALENVPGWWSRTSNLIPLMRSSLISLQARNPGLILRTHWIRRLSYGRDVEYTPEINNSVLAETSGSLDKAYVYPGYITYSDGPDYYYLPSWFKGRLNVDGVAVAGDGYPMADQFNHAMRLPDEERLFLVHKQVNENRGAEVPEISLRMLLDKMNDPANNELTNSVVINLHGEMLPVLPLRNYSDAAKDPAYFWGGRGGGLANRAWRAVSHFERLSYTPLTDVSFRTFVYDMQAGSYADPITTTVEDDMVNFVTVFVPDAARGNLKNVDRMQGNSRKAYAWKRSASVSGTATAAWLTFTATIEGTYVTITADTGNTHTARWWAHDYTPPGRSPGLRIVFQGATPTTRAFAGLPYVP